MLGHYTTSPRWPGRRERHELPDCRAWIRTRNHRSKVCCVTVTPLGNASRARGAEGGSRTHMGLPPTVFETAASAIPPLRQLTGGDGRIRTADRGFADPRLNLLATSPGGAEDGIRTRDLLLGKEMCYHCTTSAHSGAGERTRTSTGGTSQQPLKLARLPVPPHPLAPAAATVV